MENFIIENDTLTGYENEQHSLDEVIVPDGVKCIGAKAFYKYNIKHLILPDSLEDAHMYAFNQIPGVWSASRNTTVAGTITYRGVTFKPNHGVDQFIPYTTVNMIARKHYDYVVNLYDAMKKYEIILQIYMNDEDEMTEKYIKKNLKKVFVRFMMLYRLHVNCRGREEQMQYYFGLIEALVKSGKFISKRNIKIYIEAANEYKCPEILDMLLDYKCNTLKMTD